MYYSTAFYPHGGKVVMDMTSEARSWGRRGPRNGSIGEVVGRYRGTIYRHRWGTDMFFHVPGIYRLDTSLIVQWDDGTISHGHDHDVKATLETTKVIEQRRAEHIEQVKQYGRQPVIDRMLNTVRLGDLPETPFYEGDTVRFVDGYGFTDWKTMRVTYIDYHTVRDDHFTYTVTPFDENGLDACQGSTMVSGDKIELVRRGNLWRSHHGHDLSFACLEEEVVFARNTGQVKEIKNPDTDTYAFTIDEANGEIERGNADLINGSTLPVSSYVSSVHLYRCHDRDLGRRCREAYLGTTMEITS